MNINDTHTSDDPGFGFESAETSNVRPVLMVFDQNKLYEWFMIAQKSTAIGRDGECQIVLADDTVSRRHAVIEFDNIDRPNEEPTCILSDNESRNGVFLNGKKIEGATTLRNGDRVFIGNTCLAYFVRTELEINSDQKLRSLATTDSLTGLANRGYMAIQFQREFDRSKRYNRPLTLLMLDLDDFKKVNDTYGHKIGDVVLEQFARTVESKTRIHDIPARYGGEEFAALLPETSLQGGQVIAERLRRAVECHEFQTKSATIRLTVSIGVAELCSTTNSSLERLLEGADRALLKAKTQGKNQVAAYDPADSTVTEVR